MKLLEMSYSHSKQNNYMTFKHLNITILPGTWSSPHISGTRPPPCDYFSSTKISPTQAIIFGGRYHNDFCDHIFLLDLTTMVRNIVVL